MQKKLDINECQQSFSPCNFPHQLCINTMGSYRCQCDKATSNSSFYPHNCSMCRMTCSKGGFCVIGPDFREYCKCPPPEIDPYCSGAALPLNTILGAAVAAGASVIIISLIVGYFFYQRHQSRLRDGRHGDSFRVVSIRKLYNAKRKKSKNEKDDKKLTEVI
ncbi:hypothetical protein TrispH2_011241 [Trichoplax sp. H2]|nr:hypothetical protein TrispH2_011241 [Trichoplax sp. H2]|eukprot:RDD36567.1 hypothetical protein TrispH2_011241 [Trichoplax sp. H2]